MSLHNPSTEIRAGRYRLGIDVGGTFTDLLLMDEETGALHVLKTASSREAPESAILKGIETFRDKLGIDPAEIGFFSHGTTLAVNTLLERNGASAGLLVTRGFRDILELRRLRLPKPNDFFIPKPVALVPRRHVREIDERLGQDGTVLQPIRRDDVLAQTDALIDDGVTALSICFLHSYRDPRHERQARAWIAESRPDLYVCTSTELWPQQREYERSLIAVINAYVGQRMRTYFATLGDRMAAAGVRANAFSTKSNGGLSTLAAAGARPVDTLLSGPASGVIGAAHVAARIGDPRIVTLDMGGTSVDIGVIRDRVTYSTENTVGDFPVIMPAVDVSAIGAGGGSIAWIDAEGVLKVGPRSAGARPGPAAYDRGGEEPTVTDAYLTVGICDPGAFLGGTMHVDRDRAVRVMTDLGAKLGLDAVRAADAVLRVATANIHAGLLPQLARRGVEARDFSLLPYGAAGPTHAFLVAREIAFRRVIVPPAPGLLCALGCLVADLRADFVRTVWTDTAELSDTTIAETYAALEAEAADWLAGQQIELAERRIVRSADICYVGQSFELDVPFPEGPLPSREAIEALFHARYEAVYGRADRAAPVRLLEARVQIVGVPPKPAATVPAARATARPVLAPTREIYDDGETVTARIVQRDELSAGDVLDGPLVVHQYDTTTYVPRGFRITVDADLNLIGERTA